MEFVNLVKIPFGIVGLTDGVKPTEGQTLQTVDAAIRIKARCKAAHEVVTFGLFGLKQNVQIGRIDVVVAEHQLFGLRHGRREGRRHAGLACAALAAQYDDLMHDGLPRKGC